METLARQICFEELKFPEDEPRGWGFQVEGLEVVTQEVPFELFVRGAFTRKGFRDSYMTFEEKYGHFALLALSRIIGKPHEVERFIQNPQFRENLLREEEYRLWEKRQGDLI